MTGKQNALYAAREWLSGAIKLPQTKAAILDCHVTAREADGNPVAQAAARAIGQSVSTIHSASREGRTKPGKYRLKMLNMRNCING